MFYDFILILNGFYQYSNWNWILLFPSLCLFSFQASEHLRFEMDEPQLSHVIQNLEEIEKQIEAHCQ